MSLWRLLHNYKFALEKRTKETPEKEKGTLEFLEEEKERVENQLKLLPKDNIRRGWK